MRLFWDSSPGITIGLTLGGFWLVNDNGHACPFGHKEYKGARRCYRERVKRTSARIYGEDRL